MNEGCGKRVFDAGTVKVNLQAIYLRLMDSNTTVYSSLCTLVHGQTCWRLTLDKAVGGLRVPFTKPIECLNAEYRHEKDDADAVCVKKLGCA